MEKRLSDQRGGGLSVTWDHNLTIFHAQKNGWKTHHLSSVENPGWLFDIGDYTTQLYGDYSKPI